MFKIWVLLLLPMTLRTATTISGFFVKEPKMDKEKNLGVDPKFSAPILNMTVPVSRDAVLTCKVHDLHQYKVAWLKVDTQTILTIQNHVITKNHRISITNTEKKIWQLRIREVKESDRGWYMCQINTDPMKSQMGFLNVVISPDIVDNPSMNNDVIVHEYENVTLSCSATGSPEPTIFWKREERTKVSTNIDSKESNYLFVGPVLQLPFITHHQAGAYLCIASNGIPPMVSKRLKVVVNFKPKIFVQQRVIHATVGQRVTLECLTESFPNSVNFWMRANDDFTSKDYVLGGSYNTSFESGAYVVDMKLAVRISKSSDFGVYKCIAKNALGNSEETLKILPSKSIENSHIRPTNHQITFLLTKNDSSNLMNDDDSRFMDTHGVSRSTALMSASYFFVIAFLLIAIIVAI